MKTVLAFYQLCCCSRLSPFKIQGCAAISVLTIQTTEETTEEKEKHHA